MASMIVVTLFWLAAFAGHVHGGYGTDPQLRRQMEEYALLSGMSIPLVASNEAGANISQCDIDVNQFVASALLRKDWAIKMLDATGKVPSGIAIGNLISLGSFSECVFDNILVTRDDGSTYLPEYCVAYVKPNNTALNFWLGMCLPESCNNQQVLEVVRAGFAEAAALAEAKGQPEIANLLRQMITQRVVCQERTLSYTAWGICALVFIGLITAIVTVATAYDLYLVHWNTTVRSYWNALKSMSHDNYKELTESQESLAVVNTGNTEVRSYAAIESNGNGYTAVATADIPSVTTKPSRKVEPGLLHKVLLCFSLKTNVEKFLNTDPPKTNSGDDQITCAHGMRVFSMTWVVLGHTFYVVGMATFNPLNTVTQFSMYVNSWTFMAILNGILSVDTFFTMSGLLTSYLGLKQLHKIGGPRKLNWALFYVHRYLRLTPVYAVALFLIQPLFRHLYYGPIWQQQEVLEPACATNWWTNMLYINNLVNDNQMCMGHTWYLANDMQFYVISPLILIPWFYSAIAGFVLSGALVVTSIVSTATIVVQRNYSANLLAPAAPPEGFYQSVFHDIYTKPYSRVGVYAVGLMAGYIMYRISLLGTRKERFLVVYRGRLLLANIFGWAVAAFFCLSTVYSPFDMQRGATIWSPGMNAFYMSTARLAWSIGICYVIIACAYGYGGWVNKFLSWRFFIPFSRLTYSSYLVHLYVIEFLYWSSEQPIAMSVIYIIYYYFGHVAISYAVGFVFSMLFEAPMFCLEKVIFKR